MMTAIPRIVIDARPLSHPQNGGFKAYVRSLVRGFAEREAEGIADVRLLLYLDRPLSSDVTATLPPSAETRVLSPDRLKSDFLLFAQQVRKDRPDLVHGTVNYLPLGLSGATTVTMHDAMGIKSYSWSGQVARTWRQRAMDSYWGAITRLSARVAGHILTVSNGAAAELASTLRQSKERFSVVYNGVAIPTPSERRPRAENAVLAIASPDLRKNLILLYRALSEEKARFHSLPQLQVVCTHRAAADIAEARIRSLGIENYRLFCNLDDTALANAYAQATVFVWPSLMEGFGMPPLEAMRTGCPVVSSSAPVMPEILGDVPRYFDPMRPDELAVELNALLRDRRERADRSERGRIHSRQFTCRRMAEETVAVWRRVLSAQE